MTPASLSPGHQLQRPVQNRHIRIRWDDINSIGFYRHAVRHLVDRHLGLFGQQATQHARVLGVQVLHQHEGHTGIRRQMFQQLCEGF
jgi:hypothetical protein